MGPIVDLFWNKHAGLFPILHEMARILTPVLASSSVIEREFSKISRYPNREKNRLTAKRILTYRYAKLE